MVKAFLIDLDGTLYLGDTPVEGSAQFLNFLKSERIPFLLLTNNSTRTPEQVSEKLRKLGMEVEPEKIYTSASALEDYLKEHYPHPRRAYIIGEDGIKEVLRKLGWELLENHNGADFVIVGLDRMVNYDKLSEAVLAIQKGATFIACNRDSSFPTPYGFLPGAGAIVNAIVTVTKVEPIILGKPNDYIIKYAVRRLNVDLMDVAVVGDRLDTDILLAKRLGMKAVLVMTGVEKKPEEIEEANPDFVFKDVGELWKSISKLL